MVTARGVPRSQRSQAGALGRTEPQPSMDAGGNRFWFTQNRQAPRVDHGDCRGALAGWGGGCDRGTLRRGALGGAPWRAFWSQNEEFQAACHFKLTARRLLLDDCVTWTLSASLTTSSSCRKCSKRRTSGHSVQVTFLLPIAGTTRCSPTALGFGSGSILASVAEPSPQSSNWEKKTANASSASKCRWLFTL